MDASKVTVKIMQQVNMCFNSVSMSFFDSILVYLIYSILYILVWLKNLTSPINFKKIHKYVLNSDSQNVQLTNVSL